MGADVKTRNWSFIGYVESLPDNYASILTDDIMCKWARSPLHDLDADSNGELKKPHYHFILSFDGPKSYNRVKAITVDLLKSTIPKPVESMRGLIRYFIHLDNPEKVQYSRSDIFSALGLDVDTPFEDKQSERNSLTLLVHAIMENNIFDFGDLTSFVFSSGNSDWIDCLTSKNTYFLSQLLHRKPSLCVKGMQHPLFTLSKVKEYEQIIIDE